MPLRLRAKQISHFVDASASSLRNVQIPMTDFLARFGSPISGDQSNGASASSITSCYAP
jgi:hypothetical protein